MLNTYMLDINGHTIRVGDKVTCNLGAGVYRVDAQLSEGNYRTGASVRVVSPIGARSDITLKLSNVVYLDINPEETISKYGV